MSNRQQRRHPQHSSLPMQYPSKKRNINNEKKKAPSKKKDIKPKGNSKVI